jgi:probable phosphoglycerate mutase
MLELYMVRHGQTDMSRTHRYCGRIDPPLNDCGLAMARCFGESYAAKSWDAAYCSPWVRTRQTLAALTALTPIETVFDEGIAEISYGEWEGLLPEEAEARFPDAYQAYAEDSSGRAPPGGETAFDVAARAMRVVDGIQRAHAKGRVLVVSHKATLRIITAALIGLDVRRFRDRIAFPVASVARFEVTAAGPLLTVLGDTCHLSQALRDLPGS